MSCRRGSQLLAQECFRNVETKYKSSFDLVTEDKKENLKFDYSLARWITEEWSNCTKKCGGGKQKRRIKCRQKISHTKDKKLKRRACNHLPKPLTRQKCNEQECPPTWHIGKWSKVRTWHYLVLSVLLLAIQHLGHVVS